MSVSPKPAIHAPTSRQGVAKAPQKSTADPRSSALLAMDMGWKLLIVVLLPLLLGRYMDRHAGGSIMWTVIGLVIGLVGTVVVVVQTVRELNALNGTDAKDETDA